MTKTYNTPKRHHIIKTRLNDEEYEHFQRRLEVYGMNQSAFIRKALSEAIIRPVIVASLVNDDLLAALGKLTAEYGRIGNNLNQIARYLNAGGMLTDELRSDINARVEDVMEMRKKILTLAGDYRGDSQTLVL